MSVNIETIDYVIAQFFPEKRPWSVYKGKSGYNNTTRYIEMGEQKYILRIYETHKDESKVKLEHEVLLKLKQNPELPFQIPVPLFKKDGETMLRLNDQTNRIACIYRYIEGYNPVFDNQNHLYSFGKSVGYLLDVLKKVEVQQPFVYRPYYEIEHSHPTCPIEKVIEWCLHPTEEFKDLESQLAWIAEQILNFQHNVPYLKTLPHQIIHGDLNESNVLAGPDESIHAILDFEFITHDLRVMETAVCISEIAWKEPDEVIKWEKVRTFISGFSSVITLSNEEIQVLPILIQLRRLDVFIHFLGRYLDGIDNRKILKDRIIKTAANPNWLQDRGGKLISLWVEEFSSGKAEEKQVSIKQI